MEIFTVSAVFIHIEQIIDWNKHEQVCNEHEYCHVEMPNEDNKIL